MADGEVESAAAFQPGEKKICRVCGEEIAKYKGLHYGGLTCYSCRAFFRRCHSADRKEPFKAACKDQSTCEVTVKNRRKCPSCRYDRCLVAGMRPDLVLTQEEKEERFKKFFQKRAHQVPPPPGAPPAAKPPSRRRGQRKPKQRRQKGGGGTQDNNGEGMPPVTTMTNMHVVQHLRQQVPLLPGKIELPQHPIHPPPGHLTPPSSASQPSPPAVAVKSKAPPAHGAHPQATTIALRVMPNGGGIVTKTLPAGVHVNGNGTATVTDANLMELCLSDVNNILKDCEGNILHPRAAQIHYQHQMQQRQQQQQQHQQPVPGSSPVVGQQSPVFLQQAEHPHTPQSAQAPPFLAAAAAAAANVVAVATAPAASTAAAPPPATAAATTTAAPANSAPISYVVSAAEASSAPVALATGEWGQQKYILEKL